MKNINKKQILIMLILAVSFLIEYPLRTAVISILSFSQPLGYIVINIVFYVALFMCFLITLKPDVTPKSVIKSVCLAFGFFIFEQIVSTFLFSEFLALVYEIIRPLIIFAVILLANCWLFKNKLIFNKLSWVILGCIFAVGALFNVLEYIRIVTVSQNMGSEFFSALNLLTPSNSVYSTVAKLCTYALTFILFVQNKKLENSD